MKKTILVLLLASGLSLCGAGRRLIVLEWEECSMHGQASDRIDTFVLPLRE